MIARTLGRIAAGAFCLTAIAVCLYGASVLDYIDPVEYLVAALCIGMAATYAGILCWIGTHDGPKAIAFGALVALVYIGLVAI